MAHFNVAQDQVFLERLKTIVPQVNRCTLEMSARFGELQAVLSCCSQYAASGATQISVDLQFASTIQELRRRGIHVEPLNEGGFAVSWLEEVPPELLQPRNA